MEIPLTILELAARIKRMDTLLMSILNRRLDLARAVEQRKFLDGATNPEERELQKIYHAGREEDRLNFVHKWAEKHGMNTHFARALLYLVIDESCKQQTIQMQNRTGPSPNHQTTEQWYNSLRENLILLAADWAEKYDDQYESEFFATRAYREFEEQVIVEEIKQLPDTKVLLDLGCATGRVIFRFAEHFEKAIGYDISSHMVAKANSKINGSTGIAFEVADLENGIPQPDHSVSMVVMNLGTASDIRGISKVVKDISRVLRSHGRFVLSFYNKEALIYNWDFIPWQVGLAATVNTYKDCLEVGGKSVYGRAYSVSEVSEMLKGGITASQVLTYPTISALLPTDLFESQREVQEAVVAIDRQLAADNAGAYIIVTGQKV